MLLWLRFNSRYLHWKEVTYWCKSSASWYPTPYIENTLRGCVRVFDHLLAAHHPKLVYWNWCVFILIFSNFITSFSRISIFTINDYNELVCVCVVLVRKWIFPMRCFVSQTLLCANDMSCEIYCQKTFEFWSGASRKSITKPQEKKSAIDWIEMLIRLCRFWGVFFLGVINWDRLELRQIALKKK